MREIGGYFQIESYCANHYHNNAIRLNTGRNCLEYIIKVRGVKELFVPYYSCSAILEPVKKLGIKCFFYHIDDSFNPLEIFSLGKNSAFLYINYFGVNDDVVNKLFYLYGDKLLVDNTQSFFSNPLPSVDTFYSVRKFFGVPDGGYLYINQFLDESIDIDLSYERISHLVLREELGANYGYPFFLSSEKSLSMQSIKKMSALTEKLCTSINYIEAKKNRNINFNYLNEALGHKNRFSFNINTEQAPMVYPYYTEEGNLRERLASANIYTACYWKEVLDYRCITKSEKELVENIIALPIDHRYSRADMDYILERLG
ncbi:hypothetical protein [Pectobacterium aroidearum]|uniref:hypothetical protein n=1 Tax=Pectobacterium aroidearum TaxID=1201031 RepID=UPI0015F4874F|nr:hypothetical protein [Pectobacterium aroidearum]MBA5601147.1 hypothetical protein [Pectobacterium aroidearum]